MALTKVTGHVIKSDTNITSHNINSSGIVTAVTFDGNFTGVAVTFTGDSTIGSLGITTNLNVGGISTFTGNIDANGDIDVDGHTNLDNVSVAGVTTFASNVNLGDNDKIILGSGNRFQIYDNGTSAIIDNSYGGGSILRLGSGNQVVLGSPLSNNQNLIRGVVNGPAELYYAGAKKFETTNTGASVTGNLAVTGNMNVEGVLTYQDVTNIDSIGIVTARSDIRGGRNLSVVGIITANQIKFADSNFGASTNQLRFGSSDDMLIYHDGNNSVIKNQTNDLYIESVGSGDDIIIKSADDLLLQVAGAEDGIKIIGDGAVELYHNGTKKAETSTQGILTPNNLGISFGDGGCKVSGQAGGGASVGLFFMTNSSTKWQITGDGHLLPDTAGAVDIGSASKEIGHIFMADNKTAHFGSDQDLRISFDGGNAVIRDHTGNGSMRIANNNQWIQIEPTFGQFAAIFKTAEQIFFHSNQVRLTTTSTGITVGGEVAASQDYPNLRPTLDFNFAAEKKLDPRIVYYRTGPASFINEFGKVVLVGDNVPRFDHDPTTRESKGLLFEESRTNFMKYSDEFAIASGQSGGNWDPIGGASHYTRVSDTTETKDPTGITNHASKLTFVGGNATLRGYWYSGAANGAVAKTYSVYLKRATSNTTTVIIDIGDQDAASYTLTDEWKRYSVTTSSAGNGNFVDMTLTTGASTPYYAWGAQMEAGSFATSYIPTSSAAITRGADIALIDGEEFSDFYNPIESSILVDYTHLNGATISNMGPNARPYRFRAVGGADTRIDYVSTAAYHPYVAKDGSAVASLSHGSNPVLDGGVNRSAVRVKENSFAVSCNGSAVSGSALDTSGAWPPDNTITEVSLGGSFGDSSLQLSGHIQRFAYYPVGLPNSQLVTLTS